MSFRGAVLLYSLRMQPVCRTFPCVGRGGRNAQKRIQTVHELLGTSKKRIIPMAWNHDRLTGGSASFVQKTIREHSEIWGAQMTERALARREPLRQRLDPSVVERHRGRARRARRVTVDVPVTHDGVAIVAAVRELRRDDGERREINLYH